MAEDKAKSEEQTRAVEQTKTPARLVLNEAAAVRRKIIARAGELVRKHPGKFRVSSFDSRPGQVTLGAETTLSYKDQDDIILALALEIKNGRAKQVLRLNTGSVYGPTLYKLEASEEYDELRRNFEAGATSGEANADSCQAALENWLGEDGEGASPLLIDNFVGTGLAPTPALELLSSFSKIKLPGPRLGHFFVPTLQEFFAAAKKRGGQQGSDVTKLLS